MFPIKYIFRITVVTTEKDSYCLVSPKTRRLYVPISSIPSRVIHPSPCHPERVHFADAKCEHAEFIEAADVVLADVPCSGLGVIGKKADIKYRLTEEQLQEIVSLQRQILTNVCKYIKPGGTLLYSTCTVNTAENNDNVKWMTENLPLEVISLKESLPKALQDSVGEDGTLQLYQGVHRCDGFYIAKLKKEAE